MLSLGRDNYPPNSHRSHIPQELVENIIDEVRHDTKTLVSCSLVSSSFRITSQKHLFKTIAFHGENKAYYEDFYHLSLTNSELPKYIRNLRLYGLSYVRDERTILPEVLNLFRNTRLRELVIDREDHPASMAAPLGARLSAALLELIQASPLVSIVVDPTPWPLNTEFPRIQDWENPFSTSATPLSLARKTHVQELVVLHLAAGGLHELCAFFGTHHPHLRKITVCCLSQRDVTDCQGVLQSAAHTLEEFHLSLRGEAGEGPVVALPNLRHLSVSGSSLKVIQWLVEHLRDVAKTSRLKKISVFVWGVVETYADELWEDLQFLVAKKSTFPDLTQVTIFFDGETIARMSSIVSFKNVLTAGTFDLTFVHGSSEVSLNT